MNTQTELGIRVVQAILEDERTQGVTVDVLDNNGVITLTGTAPSVEARDAVLAIAEQQPGVKSVTGDIAIDDDGEGGVRVLPLPFVNRPGGGQF